MDETPSRATRTVMRYQKLLSRVPLVASMLTVLGVARPIGLLLHWHTLTALGNIFAVSPSPSPYQFVTDDAYGSASLGSFDGCAMGGGEVHWFKWEHATRARLPGPHRRVMPFLIFDSAVRGLATADELRLVQTLAPYYFCGRDGRPGPLAQAGECPAGVRAAVFRTTYPITDRAADQLRVPCPE